MQLGSIKFMIKTYTPQLQYLNLIWNENTSGNTESLVHKQLSKRYQFSSLKRNTLIHSFLIFYLESQALSPYINYFIK